MHSTKKQSEKQNIRGAIACYSTLPNVCKNTQEQQGKLKNNTKQWKTQGLFQKSHITL